MFFIRKNFMAFTGLFLCFFIVIHLGGNLILLLPDNISKDLYNIYSRKLNNNIFIKLTSVLLYISMFLHCAFAVLILKKNKESKGKRNFLINTSASSSWTSQNMGLLGFSILFFIIIHLSHFWMRIKLGIGESVPLDTNGEVDVYSIVTELFKNPLYVFIYIVFTIPLAMHIRHGFSSAFNTLGLYNLKYIERVRFLGKILSSVVFIGFTAIPIIVYLKGL